MSEQYVSKIALTEAVYLSMHDNPHKDGKIRLNHKNEHTHFVHMIYHAPAADVIPVVHARWIYFRNEAGVKQCKCSECIVSYGCLDTPYCPNCGAKMDLERQGTDE